MFSKITSLIERTETQKIGFSLWIASALSVIFIRNSVESLIEYHKLPDITPFDLLHVPVFFLSVLLAVIIILHLFSGTGIVKASKTSLMFFPLILLPVVIDFVPSLKSAGQAVYTYNYIFEAPWPKFLNFFNPFYQITDFPNSLRLEIALVTLLSFIYLFAKTKKAGRSAGGAFLVYAICFGYGALPAFIINGFNLIAYPLLKFLYKGPVGAMMDENVIVIFQLAGLVVLTAVWYFRYDVRKFRAIAANLRWDRSVHYLFLAVLGLRLANPSVGLEDMFVIIRIFAMLAALYFAFQHAVVMNDIEDFACDQLSNTNRPLVRGVIEREEFLAIGNVFLAFALLFAFWVSQMCFMTILLYVALAYIYSVPPFRMKRYLIFSVLILGAEAFLSFLLGQASFSPAGESLKINAAAGWLVFLMICLGESVKDLKDVEGDRADGVSTLPVLMGMKDARLMIGCLVAIGYLLTPLFLVPQYAYPALTVFAFLFGGISFWYINQPNARERYIFLLYFAYGALLLILLK